MFRVNNIDTRTTPLANCHKFWHKVTLNPYRSGHARLLRIYILKENLLLHKDRCCLLWPKRGWRWSSQQGIVYLSTELRKIWSFLLRIFFRKCDQILHEKLHFLWSAVHKREGSSGIVKLQNCYLRSVYTAIRSLCLLEKHNALQWSSLDSDFDTDTSENIFTFIKRFIFFFLKKS